MLQTGETVGFIGRPLGEAYQSANAIPKVSVRPTVTRVICGETGEHIEFIFVRYLPLDNSNPHPKVGPIFPQRGLWASTFWVLWEGIGQL